MESEIKTLDLPKKGPKKEDLIWDITIPDALDVTKVESIPTSNAVNFSFNKASGGLSVTMTNPPSTGTYPEGIYHPLVNGYLYSPGAYICHYGPGGIHTYSHPCPSSYFEVINRVLAYEYALRITYKVKRYAGFVAKQGQYIAIESIFVYTNGTWKMIEQVQVQRNGSWVQSY